MQPHDPVGRQHGRMPTGKHGWVHGVEQLREVGVGVGVGVGAVEPPLPDEPPVPPLPPVPPVPASGVVTSGGSGSGWSIGSHARHSENVPIVGDARSNKQLLLPMDAASHMHSATSPIMQGSPV